MPLRRFRSAIGHPGNDELGRRMHAYATAHIRIASLHFLDSRTGVSVSCSRPCRRGGGVIQDDLKTTGYHATHSVHAAPTNTSESGPA